MKPLYSGCILFLLALAVPGTAISGPTIIAGTDADNHPNPGTDFMAEAFNNLAPDVGNNNESVVCVGCDEAFGTDALGSFNTAVDDSDISDWDRHSLTDTGDIASFFENASSTINLDQTGIVYMPSAEGEVSGGISDDQVAVVNDYAAELDNFVGGAGVPDEGGGLFAQSQSQNFIEDGWGWLETLLPGLETHHNCFRIAACDDNELFLTDEGKAAFPNLTDDIISNATPWHTWFTGDLGGLEPLVEGVSDTGTGERSPVVIGGDAETTFEPSPVPAPASLGLLALGMLGLLTCRRAATGNG